MRTVDPDRLRAGAVATGVVGGLLSGATGDYGDADDSRSRVLPAKYAFSVWAPVYAGSLAYAAGAMPTRADHRAQHGGDDGRVVGVAEHRDEVDRDRQVGEQQSEAPRDRVAAGVAGA